MHVGSLVPDSSGGTFSPSRRSPETEPANTITAVQWSEGGRGEPAGFCALGFRWLWRGTLSKADIGWGCLSFQMFPAVSGMTVGWDLVKHNLCPVVQLLDGQLGPSGVSGGSCYHQRGGCLLLGVVGSSFPLYTALSTRWRHRLILRECKFHREITIPPPPLFSNFSSWDLSVYL